MKGKAYCIAFGCLNDNRDSRLTFFTLPKDIERRRKWLTLIDRTDLVQKGELKRSSYLVCSAHFDDSSIKIIKHLQENALPSILLPEKPQESSSDAQSTSRSKRKVTILSDNIIKQGSCSQIQSTPVSIEGKDKRQVIVLSNYEENVGRGIQKESLQRTVETQTSNSGKVTLRKRKASTEIRDSELERGELDHCGTDTQFSSAQIHTKSNKKEVTQPLQGLSFDKKCDPGERILEAATTIREPCTVCCVFGCRNNVREHPDKFYFAFPIKPERYLSWLSLINRSDLADKVKSKTSHRVCSDHFDAGDFDGVTLRDEAMPHLKLPTRGSVEYVYSGEELADIKVEPSEDSDAMEVEIHFEPEAPPTVTFNEPGIPKITQVRSQNVGIQHTPDPKPPRPQVTPMNIENVDIPPITVSKNISRHKAGESLNPTSVENIGIPAVQARSNVFAAKPAELYRISARKAFLKNATISSIEHISLPIEELIVTKSVATQTTKDLIDKMNAPLKKKYEQELREAKEKLRKIEKACKDPRMDEQKFLESCDRYLDERIANIVKSHASLLEKSKGNGYSQNFKVFALNLYLCSPQSYKFVQQFFYLPSMTTIHRFQTPVRTGFNENLMLSLKVKVDQMTEKEKICTVCFDYMEVNKNLYYDVKHDFICGLHEIDQVQSTEPAKYAPVIMVKGLYTKWTQPVAFALAAEKLCYPELKEWLHKTIAILLDLGFIVKAFTANQDTEFLDFSDISMTESFIEVYGHKIYQFFDVAFLFKSAREDFTKYDFYFGDKVAKLSHVLEVYNADKEQELRLMPKITDQHFTPAEASENDLKLSIELFSRAVAAAMNFHVNNNLVHENTAHTVEFIQLMNNLFDILNSQKSTSDNEFKKAYKGTEEQKHFLGAALEYLQQLQMVDEFGNLIEKRNFVTGLLITIKSLVSLMEDLQEDNLKYIHTKHLSKDCMEGFFKRVRERAGTPNARPTSIMFARSFKRLFLMNLVSNAKKGGTEIDLKATLAKISEYVKLNIDWKKEDEEQNKSLSVGVLDYQQFWPAPPRDFIAGYLLWKCLEKHKCEAFTETLCREYNIEVNADMLLEKFKEFNRKNMNKKDLVPPPSSLAHFVNRLDTIFKECLKIPGVDMFGFGGFIYSKMEAETFEMPCECFPMKFIKFLFIRIKIFHTVKEYNMNNKPTRRPRTKK